MMKFDAVGTDTEIKELQQALAEMNDRLKTPLKRAMRSGDEEAIKAALDTYEKAYREEIDQILKKCEFTLSFDKDARPVYFSTTVKDNAGHTAIKDLNVVYVKKTFQPYKPMLQGPATNRLHMINARKGSKAAEAGMDFNGNATIIGADIETFFKDFAKLEHGFDTSAKMMLDKGLIELAKRNHYPAKKGQRIETQVSFSLEEYGKERGFDVMKRATSTPEEAEREEKRLANLYHEIREQANAELKTLFSAHLSWTEPGRGKRTRNFTMVHLLQSIGIKDNRIYMRFSEDMAVYLVHSYVMPFPASLFLVDARTSAYEAGYKLSLHYSIDNNHTAGTNDIISVKALLAACPKIPTVDELQASADFKHWRRRIQDQLENALDELTSKRVIASWEYCNSKRAPLSRKEIDIPTYDVFESLYIHFTMPDAPDQTERLQHKEQEKKAAARRKKRAAAALASKKKAAHHDDATE